MQFVHVVLHVFAKLPAIEFQEFEPSRVLKARGEIFDAGCLGEGAGRGRRVVQAGVYQVNRGLYA